MPWTWMMVSPLVQTKWLTFFGIVAKSHLREATPHLVEIESWLATRGFEPVFDG